MSELPAAQTCSDEEALYAALRAQYGLVVRGDREALTRARARLARDDHALEDLGVLGPDGNGQLWLVRKNKLLEVLK